MLKSFMENKEMSDYTRIRRAIEQDTKHLTDAEIDKLIDLLRAIKEI